MDRYFIIVDLLDNRYFTGKYWEGDVWSRNIDDVKLFDTLDDAEKVLKATYDVGDYDKVQPIEDLYYMEAFEAVQWVEIKTIYNK
jgi:hypothetical protein